MIFILTGAHKTGKSTFITNTSLSVEKYPDNRLWLTSDKMQQAFTVLDKYAPSAENVLIEVSPYITQDFLTELVARYRSYMHNFCFIILICNDTVLEERFPELFNHITDFLRHDDIMTFHAIERHQALSRSIMALGCVTQVFIVNSPKLDFIPVEKYIASRMSKTSSTKTPFVSSTKIPFVNSESKSKKVPFSG